MNMGVDHRSGSATGFEDDAAFGFLHELLDEDRLLEQLVRAFPERTFLGPTNVVSVGYVPGRELNAVFEVQEDGAPRIVTVDGIPSTGSVATAAQNPPGPDAARALPDWNARAWTFPVDPGLPALTGLTDPTSAARLLARVVGEQPRHTHARVISYLPGKRCVLRFQSPGVDVFAKVAAQGDPAASNRRLRWLWAHPERRFAMSEPLGAEPGLGTRFERAAPGEPVDVAFATLDLAAVVDELARALVNLHGMWPDDSVWTLPVNDSAAVMRRIERKIARRIRASLPHVADSLEAVVGALAARRSDLPIVAPVMIHGDLHTANVLVDGTTPILIDLDELAAGDPEFDLALFGTRLLVTAMVRGERIMDAIDAIERLPRAYLAAGGRPIREDVYAWYVAATLIGRQAKTLVRHLTPGADLLVARLIAGADAVLRGGPSMFVLADAVAMTVGTGRGRPPAAAETRDHVQGGSPFASPLFSSVELSARGRSRAR